MRLTAVSCAVVTAVWQLLIVTRLLDLLSLTKRCEESKSGCDRHQLIAWTVQRHVDFTDCRTSLSHHGRQISESESEAQGTAKGENQQRGSEERATGLSRQGGAEKEVGGRCQAAINLWFVRRFRPAQLARGRLAGLRQRSSRERTPWAGAHESMRATSEFQWSPTRVCESHPAIANLVFCRWVMS